MTTAPAETDPNEVATNDSLWTGSEAQARKVQALARFLFIPQVVSARGAPWITKPILRRGELGVVWGDSGSGKTFFALDLALRVASGVPWWGDSRVQQGLVVYVAAEAPGSIGPRLRAWAAGNRARLDEVNDLTESFVVLPEPVQMADEEAISRLIDDLSYLRRDPILVVFDTLAACAVGLDENAAGDMGKVMGGLRQFRKEVGCATLVVHHSTKNKDTFRGSSVIKADCDMMLHISKGQGASVVKVEHDKSRDGRLLDPFNLQLVPQDLGTDEDGDLISVPRLELVEVSAEAPDDPNCPRTLIVRTLREHFGEEGATFNQLQKAADLKKTRFAKLLKEALEVGQVEKRKNGGYAKYFVTEAGIRWLD